MVANPPHVSSASASAAPEGLSLPTRCNTRSRGRRAGSRVWVPPQPPSHPSPSPNHHPPPPKPSHVGSSSPHPHLFFHDEPPPPPPPRPPATGICKWMPVAQGITAPLHRQARQGRVLLAKLGTATLSPAPTPGVSPAAGNQLGTSPAGVPPHSSSLAGGAQPTKFPKEVQGIDNC